MAIISKVFTPKMIQLSERVLPSGTKVTEFAQKADKIIKCVPDATNKAAQSVGLKEVTKRITEDGKEVISATIKNSAGDELVLSKDGFHFLMYQRKAEPQWSVDQLFTWEKIITTLGGML